MSQEQQQRLKYYRNQMKQSHQQNTEKFRQAIENGDYPKKCIKCYKMGFTYCEWWKKGFECERYETEKGEEIVQKFR